MGALIWQTHFELYCLLLKLLLAQQQSSALALRPIQILCKGFLVGLTMVISAQSGAEPSEWLAKAFSGAALPPARPACAFLSLISNGIALLDKIAIANQYNGLPSLSWLADSLGWPPAAGCESDVSENVQAKGASLASSLNGLQMFISHSIGLCKLRNLAQEAGLIWEAGRLMACSRPARDRYYLTAANERLTVSMIIIKNLIIHNPSHFQWSPHRLENKTLPLARAPAQAATVAARNKGGSITSRRRH